MSFQIACLCEFSSTFITKKGAFPRLNRLDGGVLIVNFAVLNEIACLCEIFLTDYANKWFVPCMIACVCFQMTQLCKSFLTCFAKMACVWGYLSSWLYLYQLEAERRDLMHINWSPQAGLLRESCQISHLDFIRPLSWTASKTDKLDLLLTSTAVSFTNRCFNLPLTLRYQCYI